MRDHNTGENTALLEELSSVSVERDRLLQAAEKLRVVRDELIERAFRTKIPRKTIAAASLLKEISLYKMMARRTEGTKPATDDSQLGLFSDVEDVEPVEVVDAEGNVRVVEPPTFSSMRGH